MLERISNNILEIASLAIITFLVLNNGEAFGSIVSSLGNVFTQSTKALQGR